MDKKTGHPPLPEFEIAEPIILMFERTNRALELESECFLELKFMGEIVSLKADQRPVISIHRPEEQAKDREHDPHGQHGRSEGFHHPFQHGPRAAGSVMQIKPRKNSHRHGMKNRIAEGQTSEAVEDGLPQAEPPSRPIAAFSSIVALVDR
jgi:hypothetical protein